MGYAYELNICKFDLELYKLVGINFMAVSYILIIFLESIHKLFSFKNLMTRYFITKYTYFVTIHTLLQNIFTV